MQIYFVQLLEGHFIIGFYLKEEFERGHELTSKPFVVDRTVTSRNISVSWHSHVARSSFESIWRGSMSHSVIILLKCSIFMYICDLHCAPRCTFICSIILCLSFSLYFHVIIYLFISALLPPSCCSGHIGRHLVPGYPECFADIAIEFLVLEKSQFRHQNRLSRLCTGRVT